MSKSSQVVFRLPVALDVERVGMVLALSLHIAVLGYMAWHLHRPEAPAIQLMSVRLLSPSPVAPSREPEPRPAPPVKLKPVAPPPVTRVATPKPQPSATPLQSEPPREVSRPPEPLVAKAPEPTEVTPVETTLPPRFDANYLDNPPPRYPPVSRRLGEQGRVLLRVQVSSGGDPTTVLVHQSSGYSRLDEAAVDAVRDWRFVPARRGQQAISEWVVVPVVFSLTR